MDKDSGGKMENDKIVRILEKYRQKSISTTSKELQEEMDDSEFFDLVFWREQLGEAELTPGQRIILGESDKRIADKMRPETLQDYIDEYRNLPIREWWEKKRK